MFFTSDCNADLHGMYHCGYRVKFHTAASTPYWKVRNSWSETGFVRLPNGVNACALVSEGVLLSDVLLEDCHRRDVALDARLAIFSYLLCQAAFFPGWRLVCSTLRVHDGITRIFLSNLRSVQVHFAIQRGSFVSNRGAKEIQS